MDLNNTKSNLVYNQNIQFVKTFRSINLEIKTVTLFFNIKHFWDKSCYNTIPDQEFECYSNQNHVVIDDLLLPISYWYSYIVDVQKSVESSSRLSYVRCITIIAIYLVNHIRWIKNSIQYILIRAMYWLF